jgi:RNA polymerase sigma factor (sigma-70 family)
MTIESILKDLPEQVVISPADENDFYCARELAANEEKREALIQEFIMRYMRECVRYAQFASRGQIEPDELLSLAYMEARAAALKFDPAAGRFATYAKVWIWGRIHKHWATPEVARANFSKGDRVMQFRETVENQFELTNPNEPIVEPDFGTVSFNEQLDRLEPFINSRLNPQEKMVIDLVYTAGFTMSKIGKMLGVSRAATQATHKRALKKLKKAVVAQDAERRLREPELK